MKDGERALLLHSMIHTMSVKSWMWGASIARTVTHLACNFVCTSSRRNSVFCRTNGQRQQQVKVVMSEKCIRLDVLWHVWSCSAAIWQHFSTRNSSNKLQIDGGISSAADNPHGHQVRWWPGQEELTRPIWDEWLHPCSPQLASEDRTPFDRMIWRS